MFIRPLDKIVKLIDADYGKGVTVYNILHPEDDDVKINFTFRYTTIEPECSTEPHRWAISTVYHILEGTGIMHIGEDEQEVNAGDTIYIPASSTCFLENTGDEDLTYVSILNKPWQDSYELRL